ncbi:MAG: protoglobin domain-containing protein [Deltaproteobacteria bacterium]|nr:protoglobin domain-containing protein [Deltaproteobacteria bacterium]
MAWVAASVVESRLDFRNASGERVVDNMGSKRVLPATGYDEKEREARRAYLQLSDDDIGLLKSLKPAVEARADSLAQAFYSHLLRFPETRAILASDELRNRLLITQRKYLISLFEGDYGPEYYESRLRIGFTHDRIQLLPRWYLGAYALYLTLLHPIIEIHFKRNRRKASAAIIALERVLNLDMQLAMEAYILSSRDQLRRTNQELESLNLQLEDRVKLRTREVAALEGRYRTVIEMAPSMIYQIERDGKFEHLNPRVLERLGYSHAELADRTHDFIVEEGEREAYLKEIAKAWENGFNQFETVLSRFNGDRVEVESYAAVVERHKVASPLRVYMSDVSERNRMHRQVQQSEKLAAVGKLSSILAHEVRNPLNAMGLHLAILERRVGEPGEESREKSLRAIDSIRGEVDRLAGLVNDFLLLSRPGDIQRQSFNLHTLIDDVLALEQPRADECGIRFRKKYGEDMPLVLVDGDKLKQAMLNLVTNAIDAMSEGGSLTVLTRVMNDSAHVDFTDTGPGVPEDINVFELFFTTKSRGSGMGLNIVEGIVQQHGGRLGLKNTPGRGACFTLELPLEKPETTKK